MNFYAIAIESYGTLHADVRTVIRLLAKQAGMYGESEAEFRLRALSELSIALQVGNSQMTLAHFQLVTGQRRAGRR
jgi:hypothetical protein